MILHPIYWCNGCQIVQGDRTFWGMLLLADHGQIAPEPKILLDMKQLIVYLTRRLKMKELTPLGRVL